MAAQPFFWGDRTWGAGDRVAFTRWLANHGVKYANWAANHPTAAKVFGPTAAAVTPSKSPYDVASAQAASEAQAGIDQINKQRADAQASSAASMKNMQGLYGALAEISKGVAPQVAGIYKDAAGTEGALGKGFADAQAAIQSGEASDMSSFLKVAGIPQASVDSVLQKAGGSGATDVLYGLGGAIPATALNREGAAFSAAAAQLPATAAGLGMENIHQMANQWAQDNKGFDTAIEDLIGKEGGRTAEILQQILENDRAERALKLQEDYYGNTVRKTGADITGVDPKTGKPTLDARTQQQKAKDKKAHDAQVAQNKRNAAWVTARQGIFTAAKATMKPTTADQKMAWWVAHPKKTLADAPQYQATDYNATKKALFNQYKYLIVGNAANKARLKRQLNQLIDEAMAAAGYKPAVVTSQPANDAWGLDPGEHQ